MKPVTPTNIESLIHRQVKMWEVRQKLAEEGGEVARRELVHLEQGPWVTISRQLGSGGIVLAEQLAVELGWQMYNKEILAGIAEQTHLREQMLSRLDETSVNWLTEVLDHLLTPSSIPRGAFAREMVEVVLALARQGRAVLVGRGANWVLESRFGLRVRVVAPFEARVATVAQFENLKQGEAERRVRERDEQNRTFIRKTFDHDIDDPIGYDLVLNLGELSVDAAVEIVRAGLRNKLQRSS